MILQKTHYHKTSFLPEAGHSFTFSTEQQEVWAKWCGIVDRGWEK